ncbi:MAG: hypothetical protein K6E98_04015 [Lachnospiraceae bacterium]|nr:hypothetical protein [Lachnospiraceae bacterium]
MLNEMIASYLYSMSTVFFIRQVAAILLLFLMGYFLILTLNKGNINTFSVLLAFPLGVSVYSLVFFILLILNIRVTGLNLTGTLIFIVILCMTINLLWNKDYFGGNDLKAVLICIITVLCIAVISSSGFLPTSVTNDSLYYYSMYPKALVHFGELRKQFNVFLTDVGMTSATLNTLPFMYGFNEGFGIQWFMNINTLFIVIYALYTRCAEIMNRKKTNIFTVLLTGILISTMPYLIMSKWAMSNGYFMCFMFISVYTAYMYAGGKTSIYVSAIIFTMTAFLRMEGSIVALVLILCISTLKAYSNGKLFGFYILPVFAVSVMYDVRIFCFMNIEAPYTFLTKEKAMVQLAAMVIVSVYILFFRSKGSLNPAYLKVLLPLGLIIVNMILFMFNKTLYVENLKAFVANISNQSGWGVFPMFIIGVYVLCIVVSFKNGDKKVKSEGNVREVIPGYTYWDLCFLAYLLTAIAVSFAREDALRESIGDSGNRVMLQSVLLAFYAGAEHIIGLLKE